MATGEELLAASRLREWINQVMRRLRDLSKRSKNFSRIGRPSGPDAVHEPNTSPEYTSRNSPLFDFNQTLRGRRSRVTELDAFFSIPCGKGIRDTSRKGRHR